MTHPYTVITGASAGIGKACAFLLAQKGKNLILLARRIEKLKEVKKELESKYTVEVLIFQVDVQNEKDISNCITSIQNKNIDAVINNAGLARAKTAFDENDWSDIEQMIKTNIMGFTKLAKQTLPFLRKTQGHIINISSIAGIEGYEGGAVYCATKAYVKMLSKAMRIDLAGSGVRVTDIAPGAVDTEFSTVRFHGDKQKADSVYKGFTPLYADDIARCITFCLDQPPSVNIEYMLVMPTAQASATRFVKNGN